MSISYNQLLLKIEQQVGHAKQAPTAHIREHLHSIRTLCDLALDDQNTATQFTDLKGVGLGGTSSDIPRFQSPPTQQSQTSVSVTQDKPIKMDDGSNGDSLFDF